MLDAASLATEDLSNQIKLLLLMSLPPQVFHANADATEVVLNRIPQPVLARFVRIRPQTWKNGIALRFELYGCQITGKKDVRIVLQNNMSISV